MGAEIALSDVVHIVYDCIEPVAFTDNDPFSWVGDLSHCYCLVRCEGRRFATTLAGGICLFLEDYHHLNG